MKRRKREPAFEAGKVYCLGKVYCPMCTHTVDARVEPAPPPRSHRTIVTPGQKCQHCSASLDAGYIFRVMRAA